MAISRPSLTHYEQQLPLRDNGEVMQGLTLMVISLISRILLACQASLRDFSPRAQASLWRLSSEAQPSLSIAACAASCCSPACQGRMTDHNWSSGLYIHIYHNVRVHRGIRHHCRLLVCHGFTVCQAKIWLSSVIHPQRLSGYLMDFYVPHATYELMSQGLQEMFWYNHTIERLCQ